MLLPPLLRKLFPWAQRESVSSSRSMCLSLTPGSDPTIYTLLADVISFPRGSGELRLDCLLTRFGRRKKFYDHIGRCHARSMSGH